MSNINSVIEGFRAFILKGNIIGMAVGVIIGGAFGKIVASLVSDILMPLLGALTGGTSFNTLKYITHPVATVSGVEVAKAAILYGGFLRNILDFLIIGVCMFSMIKTAAIISSRLRHEEEVKEETSAPADPMQEGLLAGIRDLLEEHGDIA